MKELCLCVILEELDEIIPAKRQNFGNKKRSFKRRTCYYYWLCPAGKSDLAQRRKEGGGARAYHRLIEHDIINDTMIVLKPANEVICAHKIEFESGLHVRA